VFIGIPPAPSAMSTDLMRVPAAAGDGEGVGDADGVEVVEGDTLGTGEGVVVVLAFDVPLTGATMVPFAELFDGAAAAALLRIRTSKSDTLHGTENCNGKEDDGNNHGGEKQTSAQ